MRSCQVISCNNTSRRAHMNLLHESTVAAAAADVNNDNNTRQLLLVERERENGKKGSRLGLSKSCQMTVAKGQNKSILVRLWSVDKYKQLWALTTTKQL